MDWNRVEGNWKQLKGKVKEQWGHSGLLTGYHQRPSRPARGQYRGAILHREGPSEEGHRHLVWYSALVKVI